MLGLEASLGHLQPAIDRNNLPIKSSPVLIKQQETERTMNPKFSEIWPDLLGKRDGGAHRRKGAAGDEIDQGNRADGIEGRLDWKSLGGSNRKEVAG